MMEEEIISLSEIFEALKKRWLMITVITLLCTIVSALVSIFVMKPMYETSTKLFIGKEENTNTTYDNNDIMMYQKLLKTYSETIKTKDLIVRAVDRTSYDLTSAEVLEKLNVVTVADTQILQISYKSDDPSEAKALLEEITGEFIATSKALVPNGNVTVIETVALPEKPVSPNVKMNIAIAFLLGLMISVGLVFLLEYMDNTYKSKEQLEKDLDIPVLGVIPHLEV
jgi:capsular polysaccharide biosynthesis protein